ncbi:MAG: high frequency lysogenization protein HflD [Gammaproteobacteria bacterium]|nr:high frequency lysogenization protein HflD [Gammaproteobacteria bacterium]
MSHTLEDQMIALAALFQATHQVKAFAYHGKGDNDAFEPLLQSLFKLEASDVEDIYGGQVPLRGGLIVLRDQLQGGEDKRDVDLTRYVMTLMHLERKLIKDTAMLNRIQRGIQAAQEQLEHFGPLHENMIARLAGLYGDTISTLRPRIMVNGNNNHLQNNDTAARIRVLLLAGIRAAVLWRQCGGSRWQLLFKRSKMVACVDHLLRVTTH